MTSATSAPQHGILATSRYLPHLRLGRAEILAQHRWMAPGLRGLAKGQRTLANWDEDSVTMAVEAGRALQRALPGSAFASFSLVSTTLPFADRLNAGIAAAALGQPQAGDHAVVAAERRIARPASAQEMILGDGAAGVLVGSGAPLATFVAHASRHTDLVDHFRASGQLHDYGWEERWVRDEGYLKIAAGTLQHCLKDAGATAPAIARFALPAPLAKVNEAVAKRLGINAAALVPTEHETVGDLGCAQPLAMLDAALRRAVPGELILVAAFGSGCDALLLRRTDQPCHGPLPEAGRSEKSYMKLLSFTGQIDLEWGMRAELGNKTALTAAWRDHARAARFEAGRCGACGTVQFPLTHLCVNPDCRAQDQQAGLSLVDVPARVLSHTSDFLACTPNPPFQFGHVDFEGGGRVMMAFADTDADELAVGLPLRMVYRVKDIDRLRGYRRYFWKATPVRGDLGES